MTPLSRTWDAGMPNRRVALVIDSTGTAMPASASATPGEQPASANMPASEPSTQPDQPMAPQPQQQQPEQPMQQQPEQPMRQQPVQPEQPTTPPSDQPQSGMDASSAEVG